VGSRVENRSLANEAVTGLPVVAYARWTPSTDAVQTLNDAFGVDKVTRSAAGTYSVVLRDSSLTSLVPVAQVIEDDGAHTACVTVESDSSAAGTVAVKLWTATAPIVVSGQITDVSSALACYCVSPVDAVVSAVYSALGGPITLADAAITTAINGTPITGGGLTVGYDGSAAGDVDSATPSAANTVAPGDLLTAASDGGSTDTATLDVFFVLSPTTSDTAATEIAVVIYQKT
jgi:hypothetical protein